MYTLLGSVSVLTGVLYFKVNCIILNVWFNFVLGVTVVKSQSLCSLQPQHEAQEVLMYMLLNCDK